MGFSATLAASAARTAGVTHDAIAVPEYVRRLAAVLDVTASAADAGDTLDVYIDVLIAGKWVNAVHFTQQAGNGAARSEVAVLDPSNPGTAAVNVTSDAASGAVRPTLFGQKIRARSVIVDSGDADQSHTYSVQVQGA
jgi:hypothetical protein